MLGLLPLAGVILLSGEFGAHVTVVGEARAGQAPFQGSRDPTATNDPRASAVGVVNPIGDVGYESVRGQIILDYGPRILWRRPNPFYNDRPLLLHVANLSATADVSRTVRLIERASFSYGEADYQALTRFGITVGVVPPVLDILVLSAGTGLRWDASPAWRYETMFDVEHRRTLGVVPSDSALSSMGSFRQTNLFWDNSAIARVSDRNDLVLTLGLSDRFLDFEAVHNLEVFAVTPQVGWRRRLNWSTEARVSGGVTYVRDQGQNPLLDSKGVVRPVGSAEVNGVLLARRGRVLRGGLVLTVDYFVDPFLKAAGPRAVALARTQLLLEPNWTVGMDATFASSLRATPIPGNAGVDETFAEIVLPVRHLLSTHMIVEAGLRWSVRAPRIRADNVTFHERQTWIYVAFTATSRRVERWMAPQPIDPSTRDQGAFARAQAGDLVGGDSAAASTAPESLPATQSPSSASEIPAPESEPQ